MSELSEQTKLLRSILAELKKGARGKPGDKAGEGIDAGQAAEDTEKLNENLEETEEQVDEVRKRWAEMATAIKDSTDAARGFVSAIAPGFGNFDAESIQKVALEMDALEAELNKTTGTAGKLKDVMYDVANANRDFGITTQQSMEAVRSLQTEMSQFSRLSEESQKKVGNLAVQMGKLGISYTQTAQLQDVLIKGLQMSSDAAISTQEDIARVAATLGVAPERMASDFAAAAPKLAAYGNRAIEVFNKLASQSKATGLAMNRLLSITGQFDEFESAARATAQLNAVLGTTLNSVDLLTATEGERVEMIKRSMDATGKSWSSMDRFERKAVAATLGISDMDEATRLFGTSMDDLQELEDAVDPQLVAQQDLQKMMKLSTTMQDQMNARWEQMAQVLAGPVRDVMKDLQGWFSKEGLSVMETFFTKMHGMIVWVHGAWKSFMESNPFYLGTFVNWLGIAIVTVGLLGTALFGWLKIIKPAGTAISGLWKTFIKGKDVVKPVEEAGEALADVGKKGGEATKSFGQKLADTVRSLGQAAKDNAKHLIKLGFAVTLVGIGIGAAAFGLSYFVQAFASPHFTPGKIAAVALAITALGASMAVMAFIMTTLGTASAGPLAAFGFGITLIGAGIGLAAWGLSTLVTSMGELFDTMVRNITIVPAIVGGMLTMASAVGVLALSLAMLGPFSIAAFMGIKVITSAIEGIGGAMQNINTDNLKYISDMSVALNELTVEKSDAFSRAMLNYSEALSTADRVGLTVLEKASTLVSQMASALGGGAGGARAGGAAGGAGGEIGAPFKEEQKPIEVVVNVDGVQFVREVVVPGLNRIYGHGGR